ncbi:MAG: heme-binding beta-barrel domain-containing protein [Proteobacteria bacterium]|nr:heme-binding beta-barrel domain-containing protein [Pseudomonadota bacterium]
MSDKGNENQDVDYGPLTPLRGTWSGRDGLDVAPEPDGTERSPYSEIITFTPSGDVTNAETQTLAVVRYHQVVKRLSNGEVFHNQSGYWSWDVESATVIHGFVIPRGVAVVAVGKAQAIEAGWSLSVTASESGAEGAIGQSPFMMSRARTLGFDMTLTVTQDSIAYQQTTLLDIYGRRFEHTDESVLRPTTLSTA